ncbi:MAG: TAXI family TRAP transporter solute-binding subunit [Betaproteobacteria bacterium]|nr:TAXI family TRAP transporter solute-binding subunit [Betaproteobacteria bacterium]NBY14629.1 TAXI family TRAP transporter solute-binding subunit [Betaproteobacteria bacterium]
MIIPRRLSSLALALTVFVSGASFATENISIGTGGTGGVYYPLGGGFASVLSKYVPGLQATAEVTGGSVANLKLIGTGKPYIGFSMVDAAKDASNGEGKFTDGKIALRTLLILYPNRMHVVSTTNTGVKTMADLKGKRVSVGDIGSATELMSTRLLDAAKVDVKRERLSVAESVNALKDRKIDAFMWVGGLPTAAVSDLANTPGLTIQMIDHAQLVDPMNKAHGNLYYADTIKKEVYKGMTVDNKIASIANILVAPASMSETTAYNIVKTILEKREELRQVHASAAEILPENQKVAATSVPFHPGALKYFKEKGISVEAAPAKKAAKKN